ncbi:MAG: hypothetical protein ABIT01_09095 [Thermoanaerobaculia bacterium]
MSDTTRILDLLAQGKITVEQAEQLLKAISAAPTAAVPPPSAASAEPPLRFLRIAIEKPPRSGGAQKQFSVRVPLSLIRSGMRLGAMMPGYGEAISQRLREKGLDIDLSKADPAHLEAVFKNMGELTVDVDGGKARVRITCE